MVGCDDYCQPVQFGIIVPLPINVTENAISLLILLDLKHRSRSCSLLGIENSFHWFLILNLFFKIIIV